MRSTFLIAGKIFKKKRTKPRAMAQYEFLANNNNSNGTLCELTTTKTTTPPSSQQIEWVNVLWNGVKAPKKISYII